jgi:hypothetical protein
MMKFLAVIFLSFVIGATHAQETETRKIGSFTGVKAAQGIDVYLKKGDKESVRVEVTGNIRLQDVLTDISGSYLKIHLKDGKHRNINVKVYVTYVKVDKLSASSAGSIFSEETINASRMEIDASSAGSIDVVLDATDVSVTCSSAGDVELKGKAKSVEANASSAGEIDAFDLQAEEVEADASSAGTIKVNVTKSLTADASSAGGIRYRGNPDRSNTQASSGGSVKKSN